MLHLLLYAFFFAQAVLNSIYLMRLMMRESGVLPTALLKVRARAAPALTYVRPMKGADETTEACVRSLYLAHSPGQDHARVIYSFESRGDPAVAVVERVASELGERLPTELVFATIDAANPKMANCIEAYERAATEWVALLDNNVEVPQLGYVPQLERYCVPSVRAASGFIHGVLASADASARLEYATLYSFFAKGALLAETFGESPLIGKVMLVHKPSIEELGGLRRYKDTFSEDGEIGLELARRHGTAAVPLMHVEAPQRIKSTSLEAVGDRFARWALYRKLRAPLLFWVEPLLYPLTITAACVLFSQTAVEQMFFVAVHAAFVCAEAHFAHRAQYSHAPVKLSYAEVLCAIVGSNVVLPVIWLKAASESSVQWKGKSYSVTAQGDMVAAAHHSIHGK